MSAEDDQTICTVGHSTRPVGEFIELLRGYDVAQVGDIRTIPRSRHNPQYGQDALSASLTDAGLGYRHLPGLGGLRHTTKDSPNTAWRNHSFRGFADYMQTPEFEAALDELVEYGARRRTAIMCAEAVPWRCHRSLVSDALLVRGIPVVEILSETNSRPHHLTSWAHVDGRSITYPGDAQPVE